MWTDGQTDRQCIDGQTVYRQTDRQLCTVDGQTVYRRTDSVDGRMDRQCGRTDRQFIDGQTVWTDGQTVYRRTDSL